MKKVVCFALALILLTINGYAGRPEPCYGKASCPHELTNQAVAKEVAGIRPPNPTDYEEWNENSNSSSTRGLKQRDEMCSHHSSRGHYTSPPACTAPASKAHNMTDNTSDTEVAGPTSAPSPARNGDNQ
eukprot:Gb_09203 [translate_table: standard]